MLHILYIYSIYIYSIFIYIHFIYTLSLSIYIFIYILYISLYILLYIDSILYIYSTMGFDENRVSVKSKVWVKQTSVKSKGLTDTNECEQ